MEWLSHLQQTLSITNVIILAVFLVAIGIGVGGGLLRGGVWTLITSSSPGRSDGISFAGSRLHLIASTRGSVAMSSLLNFLKGFATYDLVLIVAALTFIGFGLLYIAIS
jgi:hypothetical protein